MAGFEVCPRCDRALTSVHVEAVSPLRAVPAAFGVFVVACSNCRAALGTSINAWRTQTPEDVLILALIERVNALIADRN